jgi:hypothetical protein
LLLGKCRTAYEGDEVPVLLLEKQPSRRTSLRNSGTTAAPPGQQLHRDLLPALQHSLKQSEKGKGGAGGCKVLACLVDRAKAAAAKQIVVREADCVAAFQVDSVSETSALGSVISFSM